MKKIAIDNGSRNPGHQLRGIGVNTNELINSLLKIEQDKFIIDPVDLSKINTKEYDLIHYTSFNPYFISFPLIKPAKKLVLTIHDLIYLLYPKAYPPGIKGKVKFILQKLFIKNIDQIITISETSKKDICRYLEVEKEKVSVCYLGVKEIFTKSEGISNSEEVIQKYHLPKQFILYVGGVNFNKNLIRLADAARNIKVPLVIVGKAAGEDNPKEHIENIPFINFLKKYKENKDIIRVGFVSDTDLAVIYKLAEVYCQPSLAEGFGLNALEAMASGTPVVASDIDAHKEILSDAASYFDLNKDMDLENKLMEAINNDELRKILIRKGGERRRAFDWIKTAKETLDIYEKVLGTVS